MIRADASAVIGGGHVMRCLALADALSARGVRCTFAVAWCLPAIEAEIAARGHELRRIDEPAPAPSGPGWESHALGADGQRRDAARALDAFGESPPDWVVVDHYWLAAPWESEVRDRGARVLAVDDLASRAHECDLLLDQTAGRTAGDYVALVPSSARILAGTRFALLRPEFSQYRPRALERRRAGGPVRRFLVSLGMSDPGGVTQRVLRALIGLAPDVAIDVVLGSTAGSLAAVEQLAREKPQVALHVDSRALPELMTEADLAIGAPGTSSLERCCLGLPTLQLVLAENQRELAARLESLGAARTTDETSLAADIGALMQDEAARRRMSAAAAGVTDGSGCEIVAAAMHGETQSKPLPLRVRRARADDSEALWLWRNDPDTRAASQNPKAVAWSEHHSWFERTLASDDRHVFIAERGDEPVATVRFDPVEGPDARFTVSINIRPSARGSGTGRAALADACRIFLGEIGPVTLEAAIHRDNQASRKIFEALDFRCIGEADGRGFEHYARPAAPANW